MSRDKLIPIRGLFLLLLLIVYVAIPNDRPDFTRFNAHDSESYLALSYNLAHGNGYTRNLDGAYVTHTLWPPGMAMLLMPSVVLSGDNINWFLVKFTMMLVGLVGIVFSWLYIRRLSGSTRLADIGTLVIALNPYYWHFSHVAMAEIPVFVWCVMALYLADRLMDKPIRNLGLFLLGLVTGAGVLLKGMVLGLVFLPLSRLPVLSRWRIDFSQLLKCSVFALGFIVVFASWGVRNSQYDRHGLGLDGVNQVQMMIKEVVEDPQSPYKSPAAIINTVKENLFWYGIYHLPNQMIPGLWLLDIEQRPMSAAIGLALSAIILFLLIPRRQRLVPLFLLISSMVFMVALIEIGGSERYWFAISMLALVMVFCQLNRVGLLLKRFQLRRQMAVNSVAVVVSCLSLALYINKHEAMPYNSTDAWPQLAQIYEANRGLCNDDSEPQIASVYTKNVHAFRLISGCPASMTVPGIGYQPKYSHAILDKRALQANVADLTQFDENDVWIFVALPKPLSEAEIKQSYYGSSGV
ncbi:hypothetical protein GCM10011369_27750 [Neiella marina]|uniref:Glycosyltransferase RgtA/B/C/D-like domain-containing protein n=1 Tax=Neiella marina TaxID=508461 RepID=A0A8J2U7H4_9GAMM|nr:hypothetical protein [Neiella marina]GGA84181.1 hypothetical protein GCM10011369_27750 [Neiella marina]